MTMAKNYPTAPASNRLPVLAAEIKWSVDESRRHSQTALHHAIATGEKLLEARSLVGHGQWMKWLSQHCEMSDRSARVYIQLYKNKEKLEAKLAEAADLTIAGALHQIEVGTSAQNLKIGIYEADIGFDEVWVAPSYQHPDFFYVTLVHTPCDGSPASIIGGRRPIADDYVAAMVQAMIGTASLSWKQVETVPWAYNLILFPDAETYVDSLNFNDDEDRAELAALASSSEPDDFSVQIKAQMRSTVPVLPLYKLAFGEVLS